MDSTSQQSTPRIDDSNAHDPGKMFVGGLSWNTSTDTLKDYFSKFGEVRECTIMREPESKRSRGFGFVTFVDPLAVDKVLQSGDHRVDDKKVDPKIAIPKKAQVKGLPSFAYVSWGIIESSSGPAGWIHFVAALMIRCHSEVAFTYVLFWAVRLLLAAPQRCYYLIRHLQYLLILIKIDDKGDISGA
ncbi:RNA-binding protein Musashi-like 2 [Holothuria leucospilota]|uniref:RNA-binding protein Musashi-like 2 n=1 Tax=Holothuria leucospilota TaxID=206669 RepID=A0A9Q1CEB7_HOLLE|nr:RNA-binding protein Musashi-like 2 [Holothuria leucospilota]